MIYVASPYSHPDPSVRESRYEAVCEYAAQMTREGQLVYSPIVHSHPLARRGLPGDWSYWADHNRSMMQACTRVVVLAIGGWEESEGVEAEVQMARALGKPVCVERLVEASHG